MANYAFRQLDAPPPGTSSGIADVLSAVRAEAEQIRAQAWAAGEAEGRAAGIAAARTEAAPAVAAIAAAAEAISGLQAQMLAELEEDAVEMAIRLAEQILAGVISVEPERVLDVGRNALRHLSERRRVTLVVNPDDLELVSECVDQLQSELGGIEHLARSVGPADRPRWRDRADRLGRDRLRPRRAALPGPGDRRGRARARKHR